jgi:diguanylate cyclase (GGDEF)-like protein
MVSQSKLKVLRLEGRLPSPKGAAVQVLLLCQKDDVTNQQVAHAIQADPALSARLIKLANSPAAHQLRPIISVVDAVTVLGMNTVRQMVLALSLVDGSRSLECKKFDYQNFWSHSLLTAIAAQNIFSMRGVTTYSAEEVFVLGLLGKVGSLALATAYPQEYASIIESNPTGDGLELVELERSKFGFDHNQLSQEMLSDWRMPVTFQNAILHHEDTSKSKAIECSNEWCLLNLLSVADYLAQVCLSPVSARSNMVSKLIFKATRLGIELAAIAELGDKIVKDWHDWSLLFGIKVVQVPPFKSLLEVAPLVPEKSDAGELPSGAHVSNYKLRVLLVDDDRAVLMILKMLLDNSGHTVAIAENGAEALVKVQEFQPQVIITDWKMPVMDGITFCRVLRRNPAWRNIYVFMLTMQESEGLLVEAFEAGADDYMAKPVNAKVLGARLSACQRVVQLKEELEHERLQLQKFSAELAVSNERLHQLVITDALTELPNRRFANEHLDEKWKLAERDNVGLACMMIDIDFFKQINDKHGHKVGDDALKMVGNALRLSTRKEDVVCRFGGEEFLVICTGIEPALLNAYAERLRQSVATLEVANASGQPIKLTVSIGAANKMSSLHTSEMLLQLADKRLYVAKERGRNRTVSE